MSPAARLLAILILAGTGIVGCGLREGVDSSSPLHRNEYRLAKWNRGVRLRPLFQNGREMYLWFYEWNLFDAFEKGELTQGYWRFETRIRDGGRKAILSSEARGVSLEVTTNSRGADLLLTVTNRSNHDWGEFAAIVPCLNPVPAHGSRKILRRPRTTEFINRKTWYATETGLEQIRGTDLHFHRDLAPALVESGRARTFAFSDRWPVEDTPAHEGILIRESNDGSWVAAIAWEKCLAVQAHNPWDCLHAGVRVGPLRRGETRQIRGRILLFEGTKEEAHALSPSR
jgi:hypothetical protein